MKKLISHAATVLPVKDVSTSITFYRDVLGFELTFSWGEPVDYAVLNRDEAVRIHLVNRNGPPSTIGNHTAIYIFCHDVDELFKEYERKGANIINDIGNREYHMRDFDLKDPDGHVLSFGKGIDQIS